MVVINCHEWSYVVICGHSIAVGSKWFLSLPAISQLKLTSKDIAIQMSLLLPFVIV